MLKKRKKQRKQQQQREEQQQQEHYEITQYQKIINKICSQLETATLYHYADSLLQCAEIIVESTITSIIDLARVRF